MNVEGLASSTLRFGSRSTLVKGYIEGKIKWSVNANLHRGLVNVFNLIYQKYIQGKGSTGKAWEPVHERILVTKLT